MTICKKCLHGVVCVASDDSTLICNHFKDSSRYIELPCKVGDTVYIVDGTTDGIVIGKITHLEQNIYTTPSEWITFRGNYPFFGELESKDRVDLLLGKTVFLTKEEAEKALAERSEGK